MEETSTVHMLYEGKPELNDHLSGKYFSESWIIDSGEHLDFW